jgi:hypothetical protein
VIYLEYPGASAGIVGEGYAYTTLVNADTLSVPAHGAGALLLVFSRSAGATVPSTPSGFTSISSEARLFGNGWRVSWVIDSAGTINSVTSVNAFQLMIHVYSGASGIGSSATNTEALGPPGTIPALTLTETNGTSVVAAFGTLNQPYAQSTPTGLTFRGEIDDTLGGGDCRSWDTADGVASWSSQTTTWSGGSGYGSYIAVEILAA